MSAFRYTLVADGPSDRSLGRIINWLLDQIPEVASLGFVGQVADFRAFRDPPHGLAEKLRKAVELFPCEALFVHRDADREPHDRRVSEITEAANAAAVQLHIPVVPVQMTEAWLLIDMDAVRRAAGNPNGAIALNLPPLSSVEGISDPKQLLYKLLEDASEFSGRRLDKFKREISWRAQRVADLIVDYGHLRRLPAFRAFESDTRRVLHGVARPD